MRENLKTDLSFVFGFAIFLAACSPQVTAGSAGPTLTPSPTIAPTATPDSITPVIAALQAMGITAVRLSGDTDHRWGLIVNDQGAPGIAIPDAVLDENGFVIRGFDDDGNEVDLINIPLADLEKRALRRGNLLVINDETGSLQAVFDAENPEGGWLFIDPEAGIAALPDELKLALAPDTITATLALTEEGGEAAEVVLAKSNISTVFGNLVIYRDAEGNAQRVMDIETGEVKELREAGIIELDLTTGDKLEMRFFDDAEEALYYVAENAHWFEGDRLEVNKKLRTGGLLSEYDARNHSIVGVNLKLFAGVFPPMDEKVHNEFFKLGILSYENDGAVLNFLKDENGAVETVFLDTPHRVDNSETVLDILFSEELKLEKPHN
jgi:hypothetical protein